jgi:chemotaxis protein CheX
MSLDVCSSAPDLTLDAVVAVSSDVWSCFLGADEELLPAFEPRDATAHGYVASVTVTGAWNGHVILELTEESAVRAARAMVASTEVAPGEVADAVGELANMIGGNLKGLVQAPSRLGLPLVVKGHVEPTAGRDVLFSCTADFDWVGQPVRVSVREHAPTGTEGTVS